MDSNATIRQAARAVGLVLNGAVRELESQLEGDAYNEALSNLFHACVRECLDWDVPGTLDTFDEKAIDFVVGLQAWLGKPDCPGWVGPILTTHDLLP